MLIQPPARPGGATIRDVRQPSRHEDELALRIWRAHGGPITFRDVQRYLAERGVPNKPEPIWRIVDGWQRGTNRR